MVMELTQRLERIAVGLSPPGSERRTRELGGFARYCILRIERELGARESWKVLIEVSAGTHASTVTVDHRGHTFEIRTRHQDAVLAIWDAMCRIEQSLREHRATIAL